MLHVSAAWPDSVQPHRVTFALTKRDVQPRDIQYEVFGPDLWHADYE